MLQKDNLCKRILLAYLPRTDPFTADAPRLLFFYEDVSKESIPKGEVLMAQSAIVPRFHHGLKVPTPSSRWGSSSAP